MGKLIDLTGQRFGRLVVMGKAANEAETDHHAMWKCRCDCGKETAVRGTLLRRGSVKSCGCLSKEMVRERITVHNTTHGESYTRLYSIWADMCDRCKRSTNKSYVNYGGRGIRVCAEWEDFSAFHKWALASGYRDELTIDRIDNDGDYEPSNCRWADRKEQGRNRRSNRLLTYKGQTKPLIEWAEQFQIPKHTLARRLKAGWSIEKALETPV